MDIDLRPPVEAAGIRFGMTRSEAHHRCLTLGEPREFRRSVEGNPSLVLHRPSGLSIFVYFDDRDSVEAVEFSRPRKNGDIVRYRGIDLFRTAADDLIEHLRQFDPAAVSEDGYSFTAPDLLLALWRPIVGDRYFEAVLVARPGYYD